MRQTRGPASERTRAYPAVQTDASKVALAPTAPSCQCIRLLHWLATEPARSKQAPADPCRGLSPPVRDERVQLSVRVSFPNFTPAAPVNNRWPSSSPA